MQKYSISFAEDLAMFHVLKPLALAVGDGPAAAENAKYIGVLHAFMDPLAGLYQSLDPENPLSEEAIKEQASDVAREIVERFTEEVRKSDYQLVAATDQVAYSLSLLLCCLNMSYVGSHVEAIRMGKEAEDTAWPSKEKMRRDRSACIQDALNESDSPGTSAASTGNKQAFNQGSAKRGSTRGRRPSRESSARTAPYPGGRPRRPPRDDVSSGANTDRTLTAAITSRLQSLKLTGRDTLPPSTNGP